MEEAIAPGRVGDGVWVPAPNLPYSLEMALSASRLPAIGNGESGISSAMTSGWELAWHTLMVEEKLGNDHLADSPQLGRSLKQNSSYDRPALTIVGTDPLQANKAIPDGFVAVHAASTPRTNCSMCQFSIVTGLKVKRGW
jgi:hypothetical protein